MPPVRRAVIDIGTNSVKLLVADLDGEEVRPVWEGSKQTRLGRGFYETHRLQSRAIEETARAVADFVDTARQQQAVAIHAFATSAARDAVNASELLKAVKQSASIDVRVISGEQEAAWAFRGVTSDPALKSAPLLMFDIGGGSTEFILGCGQEFRFQQSFPLGSVRLMEAVPHSDPPAARELQATRDWLKGFFVERVKLELRKAIQHAGAVQLVGTGGTTSILGRMEAKLEVYDRDKIEAQQLKRERVIWQVEHVWGLPLEERKQIVGLPKNRADVILYGAAILEAIMVHLKFETLRISTRGVRFAAVVEWPGEIIP